MVFTMGAGDFNDQQKIYLLLGLKKQLFDVLDGKNLKVSESDLITQCGNAQLRREIIETNGDQIREWMLNDLMHFLPKRAKMSKYLE